MEVGWLGEGGFEGRDFLVVTLDLFGVVVGEIELIFDRFVTLERWLPSPAFLTIGSFESPIVKEGHLD